MSGNGIPLVADVTAGQRHESTQFESVMEATRLIAPQWPEKASGDKGYSYPRIRDSLKEHGIEDVIPRRSNQRVEGDNDDFDRDTYKCRNIVERCIGWIKECRRIATRFEKLAINFVAMCKVAFIQRYFKFLDTRIP